MMEAGGKLNAQLEQSEAETYAGMWILHQPEFQVVVAFTQDGETILAPYLENSILSGLVEVQQASVNLVELAAIEMEMHQLLEVTGLSLVALTLLNIQENQVEVHIPDPGLLQESLAEAGLSLPDHVEVVAAGGNLTLEPPSNLTPAPGIFFPQLIAPPAVVYALRVSGELVIENQCLRLIRSVDDPGSLLIWQPGHFLNHNQGVVEVMDGSGNVLAREGEVSCFSPAAGELAAGDSGLLRNPLPEGCTGPYFLVGDVQLAYREGQVRTFVDVDLINLEKDSFYFVRSKANFDQWLEEPTIFSGMLVYGEDSRCLRLQEMFEGVFVDYLVFWPADYSIREESGSVQVINGKGEAIALLNEETSLSGRLVSPVEEIRDLLNQELPCDCVEGDYWVVVSSNQD
jgi:hypothetical protein